MKYLYKYPQRAFPYADLVGTNRRRNREEMEYELLDTGVFDSDRYFDVFVEYAKGGPEDILVQITAINRGPEEAELHLLPNLWFRNDWASWIARPSEKPNLKQIKGPAGTSAVAAAHPAPGELMLRSTPNLFSKIFVRKRHEKNQRTGDAIGGGGHSIPSLRFWTCPVFLHLAVKYVIVSPISPKFYEVWIYINLTAGSRVLWTPVPSEDAEWPKQLDRRSM